MRRMTALFLMAALMLTLLAGCAGDTNNNAADTNVSPSPEVTDRADTGVTVTDRPEDDRTDHNKVDDDRVTGNTAGDIVDDITGGAVGDVVGDGTAADNNQVDDGNGTVSTDPNGVIDN